MISFPVIGLAQNMPIPPSPEDPESGGIGGWDNDSPIDSYVIALAIFAVLLIFFYAKRFVNTQQK